MGSKNILIRFCRLTLLISLGLGLSHCSSGVNTEAPDNNSLSEPSIAYTSWPNSSTSNDGSKQIVSKVLTSDLDSDGRLENIFISALPNSSNKKSSILRVTRGPQFDEVANYDSQQISLLQDSKPYSEDLDGDGAKEMIFVGYDLDNVYCFEFKKNNLKKIFVRWKAKLPYPLDPEFSRQILKITYKNRNMIKVGPFGLYETKKKKVKVVDLSEDDN